ncbi:hypothetical protein Dimus_006623 [Dionaea muscipula]
MSTQEQAALSHVAMIPSPGMGHLIPIVELAKLLVSHHHGFSVTFFIIANSSSSQMPETQEALLRSLPANLDYICLPPPGLPSSELAAATTEVVIGLTIARSLPLIHDALDELITTKRDDRHHLAGIVIDPFGMMGGIGDIAKELKVPLYMYFGTAAMNLLFTFHLPRLDQEVECEYRDMTDPVDLPGCVPLHGKDFADPFQDRTSETYKRFLDQSRRWSSNRDNMLEGILLNSFAELEPGAIQALQNIIDVGRRPPVYPIGPIIRSGSPDHNGSADGSDHYLRWLDHHPRSSVLFVAFGSGGTLSSAQLHELALGLELSGQRFLWIVRSPNDNSSCPSYCGEAQGVDPDLVGLGNFLPNGFLERTRERGLGLVVPSWACQVKVLGHSSTGGFLTHCGWNSALESIMHGVPLIAWPLYAEQKTNAVLLTQGLKMALRPKPDDNGIVDREEVCKIVKDLMEDGEQGKRIRERARELKESAHRALAEHGSSSHALAQVAVKWRRGRGH